MNIQARFHHYLSLALPVLLFVTVFLGSTWVRFDRVTQQGIAPGDNLHYLDEANRGASGQSPSFLWAKDPDYFGTWWVSEINGKEN